MDSKQELFVAVEMIAKSPRSPSVEPCHKRNALESSLGWRCCSIRCTARFVMFGVARDADLEASERTSLKTYLMCMIGWTTSIVLRRWI